MPVVELAFRRSLETSRLEFTVVELSDRSYEGRVRIDTESKAGYGPDRPDMS